MSDRSQDAVMRHNAQFAQNFARQQRENKKQHEAIGAQMATLLVLHTQPNANRGVARNDRRQIEIDGVNYEITQFINRGGFGEIYKAQDRKRNRTVAMKIMNNLPSIQDEIKNEIHFLRLTKNIQLDNHPVIEYYGCKFTKENIFIAMELASSDLFTFWFNNAARTDAEQKFVFGIIIIVYVLRALIFLEKLYIIHGDIKPQNLVIVQAGQHFDVKLIDFGTVEKMNTRSAQITVDASKAHTVFFASPEFLRRDSNHVMSRHLHKKSDAWAAGVMFYILFFEKFPWKDEFDYENFCNNPRAREIVVPREGGYKSIIELLLKKNPEERSSAKATYLQMKGHPTLGVIIKSLQENFCSVDDVCNMRVPDNVRQELGKKCKGIYRVNITDSGAFWNVFINKS
jgi:serine/threonine protein kinase